MFRQLSFALLLLSAPAWAQDTPTPPPVPATSPQLVLPVTVTTPVNFPIAVKPSKNEGGTVRWIIADPGLKEYDLTQLLDPELALKATSRMFWASAPGRYRVFAVSAKGDQTSQFAICTIIVGDAPPTPPTPPGPTPPTPGPTPSGDVPFKGGDGLRILIVFHRDDLVKYPATQVSAMQSKAVQEYMSANAVKATDGTPEWRMWNDDADVSVEPPIWKDAFKLKRDKMPWIYVGNGKDGFSGPLPGTSKDITDLIGKYVPAKSVPPRILNGNGGE